MISDKMVEAAFRSEMPDALSRVISRRHIRALLTAALSAASCNCPGEGRPAASGVHPDALPDGTLSKSTAKRVEALAAASVSERARELADEWRHVLDYGEDGHELCASRNTVARLVNAIDALEQALTQQRGESSVRIEDLGQNAPLWHEERGDAEQAYTLTAFDYESAQIGSCDWALYWRGWWHRSQLYTTPQPSASAMEPGALRALVTAANAVLAENPADDGMWTLEQAVRPFNATMPAECANGCPTNQVCDYCQYAPQPSADAVRAIGWLNSDGSSYLPTEKRARMIEAGKREEASVGEVTFGKIAEDHRIALYAAPPSVARLVTAWRDRINVDPEDPYEHGESDALMSCADELESLLSAASGEKGVG